MEEQARARALLACRDVSFTAAVERILYRLAERYGEGYDRLKTIANIETGLAEDFRELDG